MGSVRYRVSDGLFFSYLSKQDKRDGVGWMDYGMGKTEGRLAGWLRLTVYISPFLVVCLLLLLLVCVFPVGFLSPVEREMKATLHNMTPSFNAASCDVPCVCMC